MTPSTSSPATLTVLSAVSTLTLAATPANPVAAQPVTLTATASPAGISGLITFTDGANAFGQALLHNGSATLTTSTLSPGPHALGASFAADSTHAAASSALQSLTIALDPTAVTLTPAQNPLPANTPTALNLRVTAPYATPTGTLTLRANGALVASTTFTAAQDGAATLTLPATLIPGTDTLTAAYSGDPENLASEASTTLTISPIPVTGTLALSVASAFPNTAVTLTATLASAASTLTPAGTLQFLRNGAAIASAPLNSLGIASTTMPSLPLGTSTFTAQFQPAAPFASTGLGPASLNVSAPFALALSPSTLSVGPGQTQTTTLTLAPLNSFTGPVTLACFSPERYLTCTVAPASASLSSASSIPATVTIVAALTSAARLGARPLRFPALLTASFALLLLPRGRRRPLTVLLLAALTLPLASCGSGGTLNHLPPGTYVLTLTAAGGGITLPADLSVTIPAQ